MISVAAAAAFAVVTDGKIEDIRLALCAVAPTPIRSREAEEALIGTIADTEAITNAAELVRQQVQHAADVRKSPDSGYKRATPAYRVEMSYRLAKRVLTKACNSNGVDR